MLTGRTSWESLWLGGGTFLPSDLQSPALSVAESPRYSRGEGEAQTLTPEHSYRHRVSSAAFNKWCNRFNGIESSLIARFKER